MDTNNKNSFSKDDLYIMMKSYENNIVLNTTLLEQQKLTVECQKKVITKQEYIYELIKNLVEKIQNNSSSIKDVQEEIQNINSMLIEDSKSRSTNISILSKEHNRINIKLYGAIGTLVVIVLGLISLSFQAFVPIRQALTTLLTMVRSLI